MFSWKNSSLSWTLYFERQFFNFQNMQLLTKHILIFDLFWPFLPPQNSFPEFCQKESTIIYHMVSTSKKMFKGKKDFLKDYLPMTKWHKSWLTIADHTSVEPLIMDRDPRYFMGVRVSHSGTLNSGGQWQVAHTGPVG